MSGQTSIDRLVEDIRQDVASVYGTEAAQGSRRCSRTFMRGVDVGIRIAIRALLLRASLGGQSPERVSA